MATTPNQASPLPVTGGERFSASSAADSRFSKYFTGKRISRNIVFMVVFGLSMAALLAFALVNGNKNIAQEQKATKERADKEAIVQQSTKMSKESSAAMFAEMEAKALAEKKKREEAENPPKTLDEMKARSEYPVDSLGQEINEYEDLKKRVNGGSGAGVEKKPRTMIAYEGGRSGAFGAELGIGKKVDEMQEFMDESAKAAEKDRQERENRTEQARIAAGGNIDGSNINDANDKWRAGQYQTDKAIAEAPALMPQVASSKYIVSEGSIIPAVLMTAIDSQLPGKIIIRTTENIYDTINGNYLLIPRGTKVLGSYNTDVRGGQDRVFIAFSRMVFPSGSSMQIGSMIGGDPQGRSGATGQVFSNFWKMLGTSLLIAGVGAAVEPDRSGTTNNYGGAGLSTSAGQVLADTAKANLQRYAQYTPKITVKAGDKITIVVAKDMELDPAIVRGEGAIVKRVKKGTVNE